MEPTRTISKTSACTTTTQSSRFRDVYQVLDVLQSVEKPHEPIATVLLACRHLLEHLERINRIIETPDFDAQGTLANSVLQIRERLGSFTTTCRTCCTTLASLDAVQPEDGKRSLPSTQWLRRRTQLRDLQETLLEHWRCLNMDLTTITYTVSQFLQRSTKASRSTLAAMLRQIETRHKQFEGLSIRTIMDQSKGGLTKFESLEWNLCLRRFFETCEASPKPLPPSAPLSLFPSPVKEKVVVSAKGSSESKLTSSSTDADPFYHVPKGRASPAGLELRTKAISTGQEMTPPMTPKSPFDYHAQKLYHQAFRNIEQSLRPAEDVLSPASTQADTSPMMTTKRTSDKIPSTDCSDLKVSSDQLPWERIAMDLGGALIHDLILESPGIWQAQQEVIWETRNMNTRDARRHAEQCFSRFPEEILSRIRERLMQHASPSPLCSGSEWAAPQCKVNDVRLVKSVGSTATEFNQSTGKKISRKPVGSPLITTSKSASNGIGQANGNTTYNAVEPRATSTRVQRPKSEPLLSQYPTIRVVQPSGAQDIQTRSQVYELAAVDGLGIGGISPQLPPIEQSPPMFRDPSIFDKRISRLLASAVEEVKSPVVPLRRASLFDVAGSILSPRPIINTDVRPKGKRGVPTRSATNASYYAPLQSPTEALDALLVNQEILDPLTNIAREKHAEQVKKTEAEAEARRVSRSISQRKPASTTKAPSLTRKMVMSTLRTVDSLRSSQTSSSDTKTKRPHKISRSISSPLHLFAEPETPVQRRVSQPLELAAAQRIEAPLRSAPLRSSFRPLSNIHCDPRLSMGGLEIYVGKENVAEFQEKLARAGSFSSEDRCPTLGSSSSLESMGSPNTPKKTSALPKTTTLSPLSSHPISQLEFSPSPAPRKSLTYTTPLPQLPMIVLTDMDGSVVDNQDEQQTQSIYELDASYDSMSKMEDEKHGSMLLAPEEGDGFCGSWLEFTSSLQSKRLSMYVK